MREILFRAKRLDNGEWVEGHLLHDSEQNESYIAEYFEDKSAYLREVDPETVCQFTGLTDKNGVKVFEGDVVETRDCRKHKICIGECCPNVWKNWCEDHLVKKEMPIIAVYAKTLEFGNEVFVPIDNVCEVIGNIFDNPELMEGEIDEDSNRR